MIYCKICGVTDHPTSFHWPEVETETPCRCGYCKACRKAPEAQEINSIIVCPCGAKFFKLVQKDFPAIKDRKGKVIRPPLKAVNVLVCACGYESTVYALFHRDSKFTWEHKKE